ncbi:cysteine--tRNA ligase [Candidatus Wolfebacteria bacterium]|nr:cysteine--tRNA ligase [Candidatus Wolfebacteria bacterium]
MLKLYNSLTAKKDVFKPRRGQEVKIYACGPTVYDFAHLGNLRTYVFEDVLRRTLKYNSYKIKEVVNITDVDDKIIKKAQEENKDIKKITEPFTKAFFSDLKKINVEKAEFYPKATDHIKEMIDLIKTLIKKGFAYRGADGSIYFDISKFKNYGKLSRLKKRELKIGARISIDEYSKEEARDFVLWKHAKPEEPSWPSPWGPGRPGWHIECSAMSMKYLGSSFDIHAGGVDLQFPHHENEIAQSEAATGKKFVNYWIHGEHLLVDGKKMSKSLGNFYTLKDLENKGFDPLAFRYLILTAHYRSKLNFTWKSLEAAQNALDNLREIVKNLGEKRATADQNAKTKIYEKKFALEINDDLNAPKAMAILWQAVKDGNLSGPSKKQLLLDFDKVLGLGLDLKRKKPPKIPQEIKDLAEKREKSRIHKQFIQADALRKKIESLGYKIEDTNYGPKITPARH